MQTYKEALRLMKEVRAIEIASAEKEKTLKKDALAIRKKLTRLKKIITQAKRDTMSRERSPYALVRKQGSLFETYEVTA